MPYLFARARLVVTRWISEKNNPIRTMAKTRSIFAPNPAVFSIATSKAASARSCNPSHLDQRLNPTKPPGADPPYLLS